VMRVRTALRVVRTLNLRTIFLVCCMQFGAYISYIRSSHTKKKFVVKIISILTLIAVKVRTIFQTPQGHVIS
jgi:hypothetical protein